MEVKSVLVTGANRGIGLEFVKQFAQFSRPPRFIFATYRDPNSVQALEKIREATKDAEVILIPMDIRNSEEITNARRIIEEKVGDRGLNLLVNNAGAAKWQTFPEVTEENMLFHFYTNAVGPVKVLKEMLPLLKRSAAEMSSGLSVSGAAVLNISSHSGSLEDTKEPSAAEWLCTFSYKISKAALNMAMRVVALTIKDQGVLVVNMCPGWVRTDMGTERGLLEASESVSSIMNTLPLLDESHHGAFLDRNGKTIPF